MAKKSGSLSRANRLILGANDIGGISSVYTLQYWSANLPALYSDEQQQQQQQTGNVSGINEEKQDNGFNNNYHNSNHEHEHHHHNHQHHHSHHKARMLLIKAQESALNFFMGYFKA